MENEQMELMSKRLARKEELDNKLAQGALTLEDMLAIPPTETSPEHHRTLVKMLSAKTISSAL